MQMMAGLDFGVLLGWVVFVSVVGSSTTLLTSTSDPWLWLIKVLSFIVFPGAFGIAAWNMWLTRRIERQWLRGLWNILLLVATSTLLYVAIRHHLLDLSANY